MSDKPWICPKCGRVYGPTMPSCVPCNAKISEQQRRVFETPAANNTGITL